MSERDLAIYCTADERYVAPSVVALTSIRRFHPEAHYCLIADETKISAEKRHLLDAMQIELIPCSADQIDYVGPWPREAFLKLRGPEILLDRGFRFSLCVDGDTLCLRSLALDNILGKVSGYAGIRSQYRVGECFTDPEFVRRRYGLSERQTNDATTNTGVIFWNNSFAAQLNFFQRCVRCWQECSPQGPEFFKGADQSLFALASLLEPQLPWLPLGQEYNYRCHRPDVANLALPRNKIRVVHYTWKKPWETIGVTSPRKDRLLFSFRSDWLEWARELGCFDSNLQ